MGWGYWCNFFVIMDLESGLGIPHGQWVHGDSSKRGHCRSVAPLVPLWLRPQLHRAGWGVLEFWRRRKVRMPVFLFFAFLFFDSEITFAANQTFHPRYFHSRCRYWWCRPVWQTPGPRHSASACIRSSAPRSIQLRRPLFVLVIRSSHRPNGPFPPSSPQFRNSNNRHPTTLSP